MNKAETAQPPRDKIIDTATEHGWSIKTGHPPYVQCSRRDEVARLGSEYDSEAGQ